MRKRDMLVFLFGVAVSALVGWATYDVIGLIPSDPGHASMVREMDGGRCTIVVGYSTTMDAEVKKGWPNDPLARMSKGMGCLPISPERLEKGGSEAHTLVFSSKAEAIEYRDRLLQAIGEDK